MSVTAVATVRATEALRVVNISKTFGAARVLSEFSITIHAGEVHALVGENGSGKSTFIKILSGYHRPDRGGEIFVGESPLQAGSARASYESGCRFVHQDLGLVESASILDNLLLEGGFPTAFGTIRRRAARRLAEDELERVGLAKDPDTLVGELAPAERTVVAIARALRRKGETRPSLLVLDEPTATLPDVDVDRLLSTIRQVARSGVGILYVSHRMEEIFEIGSHVTVLRDGRCVTTRRTDEVDQKELVSLIVGRELEAEKPPVTTLETEPFLQISGLRGGVIDDVSLAARPGEIVGIAGITGSGRESLLGLTFGAAKRAGGLVTVGGQVLPAGKPRSSMAAGVAFLPGDRRGQGAVMDLSARENLTLADLEPFWRRGLLSRKRERAEAARWMDQLDVRPAGATELPLLRFSGGNQQKILFGKWLRRRPRLLLLDEPTQGVDVGAKHELHREIAAAAENGACVVVSSSDVEELAALCHVVLVMIRGHVALRLVGPGIPSRDISAATIGRLS